MLKNFYNNNVFHEIQFVNNIEKKYVVHSEFSYNEFHNLCLNIDIFKINFLLLFNDNNHFVKIRNITCTTNDEINDWNKNHSKSIEETYKNEKTIFNLIKISTYINIISKIQYNIMKRLHNLVCETFLKNNVFYKSNGTEKINSLTNNEIEYYFNILEIITKILSREYYNKNYFSKNNNFEKNNDVYYNIINDNDYLKSIKYIKDNIF